MKNKGVSTSNLNHPVIEPPALLDDCKVPDSIHHTTKDQDLVREVSTTYNAQHGYSRISDRLNYLSIKSNIIHPSDLATSTRSNHLDQEMAILAAGGLLDRESEKALSEQIGFDVEGCISIEK
eukprot:gene6962-7511_t